MDDLTIQPANNASLTARQTVNPEPQVRGTQNRETMTREIEARRRDEARRAAEKAPEGSDNAAEGEMTRENLERLTEEVNKGFATDTGIRFQVSPDSGDLVVQVVDRESDEVIRSIPPERLVEFSRKLGEAGASGVLLDDLA